MIERRTRAGTIGLYDFAPGVPPMDVCATCETSPSEASPADPRMIGLVSTVVGGEHDGRGLETAICGDCLAEALAILFGRRHVQGGGDVRDLTP